MITKNSLFVDTAGWVYLVDRHDPFHIRVQTVYQYAVRQGRHFVTTNYILAELVALLTNRSRIPRQQIFAFVDTIKATPSIDLIYVDSSLDTQAWSLLKARNDKQWSLVDASSFVIMAMYGMREALTTDHHFTQAGFTRLPTPLQY